MFRCRVVRYNLPSVLLQTTIRMVIIPLQPLPVLIRYVIRWGRVLDRGEASSQVSWVYCVLVGW